ncbi:GNAT family N-acetyltransferase [Budvicia aquatica]|uniref:N-acetyltransferase n=1 Tax=Budvicia aquatica TaxID=82979 RepID=A0A2C6DGZ9_9GAMM|nr:GNAT family N-acetyltransferase [Budvicia aquatica]PHI28091.1 N-acetyltransferase [Budvicia aquatica]VFS45869.1 ribosomal-protein-alanine acetyltransferase [Budvicia aquatica]
MNNNKLAVSVSPVKEDDYAQWLPHWLSYQQFYKVQLSEEITLTTWKRFFEAGTPVYCAVAREGQKIVGFVHYLFHASTWAINDYCYLEDLFVTPEIRGKNIGKQLIEYVQQQAQQHQSARLYWHTQETNLTAQRLYNWIGEKPGMIEYRMPL